MKPLPAAPLTPEDFAIWLWLVRAPDSKLHLRHAYTRAVGNDRRDAALMLTTQRMRSMGFGFPIENPSLVSRGWILSGGDLA